MPVPEFAVIEIVERTSGTDDGFPIPNEIRINGMPVALSADYPPAVNEIKIPGDGFVQVTLTLLAKRVTIGHESTD